MTTDQSRLPDRIDVLVVGGGMAGLAARSSPTGGRRPPRSPRWRANPYGKDGNNPVRVPASIGANWRKS